MSTDLHEPAGRHAHAEVRRRLPPSAPPRAGVRGLLVAGLVVPAALLLLLLLAPLLAARLLPDLPNPFATDTVDRSGPAVLQALEDLSEYRAATGTFQVVLDVEDDARFLPSALMGERTLFIAVGSVDASVDFSELDERAIDFSSDSSRVAILLPAAELSEPRVDPERSYVYERRRGLLDRVGSMFSDSPTGEQQLYVLAQERLVAAAAETDLRAVAERNTREMLQGLLGALGFTEVAVTFR